MNKNKKNSINSEYYTNKELKNFNFKKIGKNVKIARNCVINNFNKISIGNNVRIDSFCVILTTNKNLIIEDFVHIASHVFIGAHMGVRLKSFSGLGHGVKIFTINDDYSGESLTNPTTGKKNKKESKGEVIVGKHVNIGSNTIILPKVKIGTGASVGGNSLINKSLKGWFIYFGSPCKALFKRSKNLLKLEKIFLKNS
jgi:acetyltransferase-like isoleucine patch superfamily enzyme